jgi:hypothetical protein
MRAGAEVDGIPVEADQLGKAQAGLGRKQQQAMITTSEPCRAIWGGENRLDLGPRQEMHLTLVMALARYREDTLDAAEYGGSHVQVCMNANVPPKISLADGGKSYMYTWKQ